MNIEREQKYIKKINALADWKEYYLESKYPDFHTIKLIYLPQLRNYERCIITASFVTITNAIRTLVYYDYIEINNIKYLVANEYSSLNPALFPLVLDECLPDNIQVQLDYCNRIYFQSDEPFDISSMSYSMSLLCGIKQHQLPVSAIEFEIEQITEEEDWDLIEIIKVYVVKMPNYGDYNLTPVFYLVSNLRSIFYVQTHVDNNANKDDSVMSNHCIFMRITNAFLPNRPIIYTGGDYKNDYFVHNLTSGGFIQLVNANLEPVDLIYPMRLSLLVEFY
jgi:hypothetical protein